MGRAKGGSPIRAALMPLNDSRRAIVDDDLPAAARACVCVASDAAAWSKAGEEQDAGIADRNGLLLWLLLWLWLPLPAVPCRSRRGGVCVLSDRDKAATTASGVMAPPPPTAPALAPASPLLSLASVADAPSADTADTYSYSASQPPGSSPGLSAKNCTIFHLPVPVAKVAM